MTLETAALHIDCDADNCSFALYAATCEEYVDAMDTADHEFGY